MCGDLVTVDKLIKLVDLVWRDGCVVRNWCIALIVLIPKKGNLKLCDNWKAIRLLDVVGKVSGRIFLDSREDFINKTTSYKIFY